MKLLIKNLGRSIFSVLLSLLIIASIAFYLFDQSPVPLDEGYYLSEEAGSFDRDPVKEREGLIQIGRQLQLDEPIFYFSLHSSLYPPHLYEILPLRERKALRALCRQSAQSNHLIAIRSHLITLLSKNISAEQKNDIVALLSIQDLAQFKTEYQKLHDQLPLQLQRTTLLSQLERSYAPAFSDYIPRFQWHGPQNRWHARLVNFFKLQWGNSWIDGRAVSRKIGEALPWTVLINGLALLLLFTASIPIGRFWALHPEHWLTKSTKQAAYFFTVAPLFWIATMSIIFLTSGFGIGLFPLPSSSDFQQFSFLPLVLPLLVIFISAIGYLARQFEDQIKHEINKDYFKMALSRGIPRRKVIRQYATKNALLPLITILGASLPALISGSLVIEVLFNIPGMGRLIWFSLFSRDWPLIFAIILMIGMISWLGRRGADSLSQWIDPRTKLDAA